MHTFLRGAKIQDIDTYYLIFTAKGNYVHTLKYENGIH